jgi:hypothetical protein
LFSQAGFPDALDHFGYGSRECCCRAELFKEARLAPAVHALLHRFPARWLATRLVEAAAQACARDFLLSSFTTDFAFTFPSATSIATTFAYVVTNDLIAAVILPAWSNRFQ